ncbi:DUF3284 domain-containing protein [Oceanivirga miroungae]|uniref:DUF3284 domain-containing protein n=1 Tax=Oceanivirga miroungae TaxID=1130046 RepID=A0A6I8MAJ2_9FUSO|nr:DUF3284 domain-containing protein [Oceanivirga miroungae]VWL85193.1 hypothetical protein OMES3154_00476 [Oceanivirga miroungae]
MKIEYILKVSDVELYDFFVSNLKLDMNIKGDLYKGMIIKKKIDKNRKIKIEVVELDMNKKYSLKYDTNRGINIVSYNIEKLDEYKTKLIYEENYQTDSVFNKSNYYILGIFYSFFFKRSRKKIFKEIEKYIISKRGEKND